MLEITRHPRSHGSSFERESIFGHYFQPKAREWERELNGEHLKASSPYRRGEGRDAPSAPSL